MINQILSGMFISLLCMAGHGLWAEDSVLIVVYNVENLFDIQDDTTKRDEEFLPWGVRAWNRSRYELKLQRLSKPLMALGGWQGADVIAFCEVENKKVLVDLHEKTPLKKLPYEILHEEGPDPRGIDVAIMYHRDRLKIIDYQFILPKYEDGRPAASRYILYAQWQIQDDCTIHIFMNHWPSKYSGVVQSEPGRMAAAQTVLFKTEQILKSDPHAMIVITGDLNDPWDAPSVQILAQHPQLHVLTAEHARRGEGTHKHHALWSLIDHVIVSDGLMNGSGGWKTSAEKIQIGGLSWLLEDDPVYPGRRPFRTYVGYQYYGGYSDHLPLYIPLYFNQKCKAD